MHRLLIEGDLDILTIFIPEERTRGIARHALSISVRIG